MNTIHLHGSLKKFGGPFTLDIRTPAEAVRALCHMKPGFEQALRAGVFRVIRGTRRKGQHLDETELTINLNGEMHLVPVPQGAKNQGATKAVIGATLIAVAVITQQYYILPAVAEAGSLAAASSSVFYASVAANAALGIGISMVLTGISMMLSPQPKTRPNEEQERSYLFGGMQNTTEQGVAVPIVLGQIRTGSVVISSSLEADAVVPSGGQFVISTNGGISLQEPMS